MALTSVFYDGTVTETDWAKNRGGVPDYGVYGIHDFEVKPHPSIPYAVLVTAGKAHGFGVTDTAATDQVVNCTTLSSGVRWDLIAVRRNWQPALGGPSALVAIPGGASAEIPAARKIGPGVEDDQPLALVKWVGGLSAPQRIIDLRVWTGNGGLFAKDDLVRTYLTGVGTEVNINGTVWALSLGAMDAVGWVKTSEIGKVPLFSVGSTLDGGTPPAGTQFLTQSGTVVQTTNFVGAARLVFPSPFPNGLVSVQLSSGDNFANGRGTTITPAGGSAYGSSGGGDRASVVYEVCAAGGALLTDRTHRLSWTAVGW
ncbi:hypothetical protein E5206_09370 [Arthrobacter sp. PAMC25564]|uniref:hypothetical protein n=1 Tax=Arthrobacter sp. PAMC25564 TaxID=2565366 RepID=UPI0010A25495|nr:hypothetical protein [Arthrobacter sp. PAMC25564]QCB97113.1 hypothetical protein E5206_09370 [Arthrobacter sp. PAMC25564]